MLNRIGHLLLAVFVTYATNSALANAATPTFSDDVAKIIFNKCTTCHRPHSSGPFSLMTYKDVQKRAETIKAVLETGYMPPWKPVDHGIAFANDRSLSDQEERTIKSWIDAGCPPGDGSKIPTPPGLSNGWALGKPDLVVKMQGKYQVPADGPDIYRSFVFPLDLPEDKWVKAVELRPRATSSVHHAIFFLDPAGNARKLDGADGKTGISGMGFLTNFGSQAQRNQSARDTQATQSGGGLFHFLRRAAARSRSSEDEPFRVYNALTRTLGGYVPGSTPNLLPGELALPLPRGSDIVMQTHFHPSGKSETEEAELALYFAENPPSRELIPIMVPAMFGFAAEIKIPPGEKNFRITDSITLPVDTQAIGVAGHAHYVCREMKLIAKLPSGQQTILLHIDDWDLDWQDQYLFAKPVDLPAGTVLTSELIYDNSADNPENPHDPPKEIRWGRGSTDEMGSLTLRTVAKNRGESSELRAAVREYFKKSIVNRDGSELARMMMQLDDDHDGKLQRSEAPPRLTNQLFQLIDANKDGALTEPELVRVLKLRDQFLRARN